MKRYLPLLSFFLISIVFFYQLFFRSLLPIPADTIVGIYYPYRDFYSQEFPRGIPFKNFLLTDPVRQQYPWRFLSISLEQQFQLPLWNPYNAAGTPLLANVQSAAFYPLNIFFFLLPFSLAWSLLIYLQVLLSLLGMYWYLSLFHLKKEARFLGAIAFSFAGFSVSWMEWGTILQTALWLPYILLSIHHIIQTTTSKRFVDVFTTKIHQNVLWSLLCIFSIVSAFFAGHLQTFLYVAFTATLYAGCLLYQHKIQYWSVLRNFSFILIVSIILTFMQWWPTLQFISLSARGVDPILSDGQEPFLPWQHLFQFIAPDYFGNPATQNYFGIWNYGEFVGYMGIISLIFVIYAMFFRRDKKTFFYTSLTIISLLFALPTFIAHLPFILHIPLVDTTQANRILILTDFSLAVLAALGWDYFMREKSKRVLLGLGIVAVLLLGTWGTVIFHSAISWFHAADYLTTRRNLYLPTVFFFIGVSYVIFTLYVPYSNRVKKFFPLIILIVVLFDLFRFGWKFLPFTPASELYPTTKTISFLQSHLGEYRFMSIDNRIMPPNFSIMYKLQDISDYDPLYLRQYGEYILASNKKQPSFSPPFNFYKIITTDQYSSRLIDLLGVKYILSYYQIFNDSKLDLVFTEGQTHVYENTHVLPRTFFVHHVHVVINKQKAISTLFHIQNDLRTDAVVTTKDESSLSGMLFASGSAMIRSYQPNTVTIATTNSAQGFLVLTDTYYPTWHAYVDGKETKIYPTDYNFRGVVVPAGEHVIIYKDHLL